MRVPPPAVFLYRPKTLQETPMVGITLSAEQIRTAPPEIRHWIEQQVAALFGPIADGHGQPAPHPLAACTLEEARAVLAQIQDLLPVVSVFFELGRESAGGVGPGIRALSLLDIQRHARLRAPEQVVQCLEVINQALRQVRGDPTAAICAITPQGRCFVAEATTRTILALWQEIVAARALRPVEAPDSSTMPIPTPA
jgi:hypothetical protein